MKKLRILSTCAAVMASSFFLQAQQPEETTSSRDAKKKTVLGIRGGIVRSNVYARTGDGFSSNKRQGFGGGAYAALPIGGLFGIQPEVMLLQKGFEGRATSNGEAYSFSRSSTHVDIPVHFQFKPFRWLSLLAGPQYSFLLGQEERFSFGGNNQSMQTEFEMDENNKGLLGVSTGFDLNIKHVVFAFRSGWDLSASHNYNSVLTPRYRNQWTQFMLGYRFY